MRAEPVTAYRFGQFVLNLERGSVQRAGIDLDLRPKSFEILRFLVENPGKLASKSELMELVWPNVFVTPDSLSQCVRDIRKLLGDEGQHFIRTVPRRGYIFVAEVAPVHDAGLLGPAEPPVLAAPVRLRPRKTHIGAALVGLSALPLALLGFLTAGPISEVPRQSLVLAGKQTVLGQPIVYPTGIPEVSAVMITLQSGEESYWHTHADPIFAYVLDGAVSVDYGSKGVRVYRAGTGVLEAVDWPHKASNPGTVPARILVVHIGAEGRETSSPASSPR